MNKQLLAPQEPLQANFNLKVWFYDFTVCESTGEVLQKEFVYVGERIRKQLYGRNIRIGSELDALLFKLHSIQQKCERVICFDNSKPKYSNERIVFEIERGIVKQSNYRLKLYPLQIKNFIPNYQLLPHDTRKNSNTAQ